MTRSMFQELILLRMRQARRKGRRLKLPKLTGLRWLFPWAAESQYAEALTAELKAAQGTFMQDIGLALRATYPDNTLRVDTCVPLLPGWLERPPKRQQIANLDPVVRLDAAGDPQNVFEALQKRINERYAAGNRGSAEAMVFGHGLAVDTYNAKQWHKFAGKVVGQAFSEDDTWTREVLNQWSRDGVSLIKNAGDELRLKVQDIVQKGAQNGDTWSTMMKKVEATDSSMTRTRAKLIARDQIGKLNGQLSQRRQMEAGVEEYRWQTSADERVRGRPGGTYADSKISHYIMDGDVCQWRDQSVYKSGDAWIKRPSNAPGSAPGWDIQCRCTSIPEMEQMWKDLENEVAEEEARLAAGTSPVVPPPVVVQPPPATYSGFVNDGSQAWQFHEDAFIKNGSVPDWMQPALTKADKLLDRKVYQPGEIPGANSSCFYHKNAAGNPRGTHNITMERNDTRGGDTWRHEFGHHLDAAIREGTPGLEFASSTKGAPLLKSIKAAATRTKDSYETYRKLEEGWRKAAPDTAGVRTLRTEYAKKALGPAGYQRYSELMKGILVVDDEVISDLMARFAAGDVDYLVNTLSRSMATRHQAGGLADILAAFTKAKRGWGHNAAYFKRGPIEAPTEIFANITALLSHKDKVWGDLLRVWIPDVVEAYKETVIKYGATP